MAFIRFHPLVKYSSAFPETAAASKRVEDTAAVSDCDVVCSDKEFVVSIDLPGVRVADLDVTVDRDTVRVYGVRRKLSQGGATEKKVRYEKSFRVDTGRFDLGQLTANLSDGVLVLSAPKRPTIEPRKIAITSSPHVAITDAETEEAREGQKEAHAETDDGSKPSDPEKQNEKEKIEVETVDPKEC